MTFTGPGAARSLIYEARKIMRCYRLWAHKTKVFRKGQPKVITGVALTNGGPRLPNKRQQAINADLELLASAAADADRLRISRRLVSRMHEAAQVDPAWTIRAQEMMVQRDLFEQRLAQGQRS